MLSNMNAPEAFSTSVPHNPSVALVTGAAGFIGSHLVERLLREGHHVVGIDSFADYYPRWIKEHNLAGVARHERFAFIEADLLDLDMRALLQGQPVESQTQQSSQHQIRDPAARRPIDVVFHLAAQPGVRASWGATFEVYARNNILATQRLLEAARGLPLNKFVYASSSSVYGNAETLPTTEDMRPQPISPYGVTKLAGEHLCLLYCHNHALPVVCLRYFTVYGPRQRPDMAFHRFIRAIFEEQEILVYGDGNQTRDFTYVDDAVDATVRASVAKVTGEVFNIGGGSRVTVNETIRVLEQILGKKAKLRYSENQAGDVRHTAADTGRAAAMLGFQPQTSLTHGLQAECRWVPGHLEDRRDH
jgi:UDP-glucose 4-epimerase